MNLTYTVIKNEIAKTSTIFTRGENIFALGNYTLTEKDDDKDQYLYTFDGSYGDYEVSIHVKDKLIVESCTCPYPHKGCKHVVAACMDIAERKKREQKLISEEGKSSKYLTPEEIKAEAGCPKEKGKKRRVYPYPR